MEKKCNQCNTMTAEEAATNCFHEDCPKKTIKVEHVDETATINEAAFENLTPVEHVDETATINEAAFENLTPVEPVKPIE